MCFFSCELVYYVLSYYTILAGVNVQPAVPNVATTEGGGRTDSGTTDGGGNGNTGGGTNVTSGGIGGSGATGNGEVMVCLELTRGNLQRNVTLGARTVSSPTSTGNNDSMTCCDLKGYLITSLICTMSYVSL